MQPALTIAEDIAIALFGTVPPVPEPSATSTPPTSSLDSATSTESPAPGFPPPSPAPAPFSPPLAPEAPSPSNHTDGARQPDTARLVATPGTQDHAHNGPDRNHGDPITDPAESHLTNELQPPAPVDAHPQQNVGPSDSPLEHGTTQNVGYILPPNPLANITNEPVWMKKKQTLDFFRQTPKLGCLSNVIQHWYELEKSLGFQDVVSSADISHRPMLYL